MVRRKNILRRLGEKVTTPDDLAEEVKENLELLPEVFKGITSANPRIKYGCAKILKTVSKEKPEALYPKMDFFVNLIGSENNILKWNAMDVIANLTLVDSHNKFNSLFKKFYSFLYDGSLITASHVVDNSGTIVQAKPELRDKITKELLKVEKIPLPTKECTNILIGKTIDAFDIYYNKIRDKDRSSVVSFVKRQLNSTRATTRRKAGKFLAKNL